MRAKRLLVAALLGCILIALGLAASSADRAPEGAVLGFWVLGSAGGPTTDGTVTLSGTLGQPVAGPAGADGITLNAGYWQALQVGRDLFLPLVMR